MTRVEEMISVAVSAPQAMRSLLTASRFSDWVSPDITVTPLTAAPRLSPGDRFRLSLLGGFSFEYLFEAETDREIVFAFTGPWRGEERWSFIADGSDTIIRRRYEVRDGSVLALLAWETVGRAVVLGHLKLELTRFRSLVEREPGVRAEIEHRPAERQSGTRRGYPIDEG